MNDKDDLRRFTRGRPLTAEKRDAILAGAAEVFAGTPFDAVLVDDVAHRAGVGKGTLYRYFSSKEDLYVGTVVAGFGALRRRMEEAIAQVSDPVAQLRVVALESLRYLWDKELFYSLSLRDDGLLERSGPAIRLEREAFAILLTRIFENGERTGAFRAVDRRPSFFVFGWTVRACHICREPADTPETIADRAMDLFVRGIGHDGR